MRTLLQRGLLVLWTCLAAGLQARAQLLCERVLPGSPTNSYYLQGQVLLKIQPDSLRLVSSFVSTTGPNYLAKQRMVRVGLTTCDTLPLAGASTALTPNADNYSFRGPACVTRRGEVLMASTQRMGTIRPGMDSIRLRLTLLGRNGRVRWSRLIPTCSPRHWASALLEAPDGGFYAAGASSLVRLDSLGRLLWCRSYRNEFYFGSPTYSRRGTLLFSVVYNVFQPTLYSSTGIFEVSQQGDSLGLHPVQAAGGTNSGIDAQAETMRPLRDGGVLFTGLTDTTATSTGNRPFLARFTSNLQVAWIYTLPNRVPNYYSMTQPFELADGTLVVFVNNTYSGQGQPFWLYRLSAAGVLLQRYVFNSLALPPFGSFFGRGYFGNIQGIQPLRDSTFMLASAYDDPTRNHTYLAHLRVPGLPRVLDSSFFPLAARSGAALAPEALGPPHPNPATETVAFAYTLPGGNAPAVLVLRDVAGRRVLGQTLTGRTGTARLALAGLPGGLYLATLEVGGQPYGGARKLAVAP